MKYVIMKNINFEPIENQKEEDENKLVFNNDNELVEYINKKYEDERRKKIILIKN